jgi:putative FmdB family regulatory protein
MPQYNFLCLACKKEFSKILTISEHEKGGIICPHCKSKNVEQRWAAFYAVPRKRVSKVESPGSHQRTRNPRQRKK